MTLLNDTVFGRASDPSFSMRARIASALSAAFLTPLLAQQSITVEKLRVLGLIWE